MVPDVIRRRAGIRPGDTVEMKATGGVITIVANPHADDDEYTSEQRRIINAQLADGLEDIRQGRVYGPFDTVAELERSLRGTARQIKKPAKRSSRR